MLPTDPSFFSLIPIFTSCPIFVLPFFICLIIYLLRFLILILHFVLFLWHFLFFNICFACLMLLIYWPFPLKQTLLVLLGSVLPRDPAGRFISALKSLHAHVEVRNVKGHPACATGPLEPEVWEFRDIFSSFS